MESDDSNEVIHKPPHKKQKSTKRAKRELTLKINAYFRTDLENRPKNEYVHIETLYNYSKPVWEFHRPSVCVSYEGLNHGLHKMENKERASTTVDDGGGYSDDSFDTRLDDMDDNESSNEYHDPQAHIQSTHHKDDDDDAPSTLQRSFMNHIELSTLPYYDRERLSRMKLSLLYIKCCIAVLRPNSPTFPKQNELHRWLDSKNHPPLSRIDIRQARKALKDDYHILLHSNSNKLTDKYNTLFQAQQAMMQIYETAKAKCMDKNNVSENSTLKQSESVANNDMSSVPMSK